MSHHTGADRPSPTLITTHPHLTPPNNPLHSTSYPFSMISSRACYTTLKLTDGVTQPHPSSPSSSQLLPLSPPHTPHTPTNSTTHPFNMISSRACPTTLELTGRAIGSTQQAWRAWAEALGNSLNLQSHVGNGDCPAMAEEV